MMLDLSIAGGSEPLAYSSLESKLNPLSWTMKVNNTRQPGHTLRAGHPIVSGLKECLKIRKSRLGGLDESGFVDAL
jgi:hypothetical protein